MASKRILKELKDLQKDPPTSCSAGFVSVPREGCLPDAKKAEGKEARIAVGKVNKGRDVLRQLEQIRPGSDGDAGPSGEDGGSTHVLVASAGDDE